MRRRRMRNAGLALLLTTVACVGLDAPAARPGLGAQEKGGARAEATDAERRAARRRWALFKLNEAALEWQRCRERFRTLRQASDCEAEQARRYREYNEIYLEASRE